MSKFKVKDRVYCGLREKWGTIVRTDEYLFPLDVQFDDGEEDCYTAEGAYDEGFIPTLSFTEYKLSTEGLTQQRPEQTYHVGQKFKRGNRTYVLAHVGNGDCALISTSDGHCWVEAIDVGKINCITQSEFEEMCGAFTNDFKLIENE